MFKNSTIELDSMQYGDVCKRSRSSTILLNDFEVESFEKELLEAMDEEIRAEKTKEIKAEKIEDMYAEKTE